MLTITDIASEVTADAVATIIDATSFTGVRVDEVQAGPVKTLDGTIKAGVTETECAFASLPDKDTLLVKVQHTLSCHAEDGSEAASITVAHIATFHITTDLTTTRAALSAWVDTNVYFLLYPYVRQFFTEMTTMLGLPPVVLDYLHRDLPTSGIVKDASPEESEE